MPESSDHILQQAAARRFLGEITAQWIHGGPWRDKTPHDLAVALYRCNSAERAAHPWAAPVTLSDLYAASERKLRGMAAGGWRDSDAYRLSSHLQNLVEQAIAYEAETAAFASLRQLACHEELERE